MRHAARAPSFVLAAHLYVIVYLCPFRCRSSSRHGYLGNFGGTFVYVYLYDCVIVSFFCLSSALGCRFSVISAARLCEYARVRVCASVYVYVCVRACRRVGKCVFCNRLSSGFRCLIDCICARECARVQVHAGARVCVCVCTKGVQGCSPIHSDNISDRKQAFSRIF